MQEATKRAAIYARTAATQEKGASFATDSQIHACIAYAHEHGYEVVEGQIYKELVNGHTTNRPALLQVLAEAQKGTFTVLVVYDYDRLARQPLMLENLITQFEEEGVKVETARDTTQVDTLSVAIYARMNRGEK